MTENSEKLEQIRARAAQAKPNWLINKLVDRAEKRLGDPYEYRRTCTRCETVRFVSSEIAEAKPTKIPNARGYVGKRRQVRRTEQTIVASHNAMLAGAGSCPSCGSSAFTEERVPL